MSEHLKQFHGGVDRIRGVSWQLSNLSAAFRRTGNQAVADELYALSDQLSEGMAAVNDALAMNSTAVSVRRNSIQRQYWRLYWRAWLWGRKKRDETQTNPPLLDMSLASLLLG